MGQPGCQHKPILVGVVGNISACHADAQGSIPGSGASFLPVSLVGQDIALSPRRPGFKSRTGNFFPHSGPSGAIG